MLMIQQLILIIQILIFYLVIKKINQHMHDQMTVEIRLYSYEENHF